jgi:hypothetical protein
MTMSEAERRRALAEVHRAVEGLTARLGEAFPGQGLTSVEAINGFLITLTAACELSWAERAVVTAWLHEAADVIARGSTLELIEAATVWGEARRHE